MIATANSLGTKKEMCQTRQGHARTSHVKLLVAIYGVLQLISAHTRFRKKMHATTASMRLGKPPRNFRPRSPLWRKGHLQQPNKGAATCGVLRDPRVLPRVSWYGVVIQNTKKIRPWLRPVPEHFDFFCKL